MNMEKLGRVAGIFVILTLFFITTLVALKYYALAEIYDHYVEFITSATGLSPYLAKVSAIALLLPLFYGLRLYFFTFFNKSKRNVGLAIIAAVFVVYNIGLYLGTRDSYFAYDKGDAAKYYANTPEGIRFFDTPGFDPKYGIQLKPATPELIGNMEKANRGMAPKKLAYRSIEGVEFFDRITGESKVWYFRDQSGGYELFDSPGAHPTYGEPLQPVTPDVVNAIKNRLDVVRRDAAQQEEEKRKKTEARIVTERLTTLKSLFNCSVKGATALAVLPANRDTSTAVASDAARQLADVSSGVIRANFFSQKFLSDGYFERAYSGDVGFLREAGVFACVNAIILARLDSHCGQIVSGVMTCDVSMDYRIFDRDGRSVDSALISANGAGFDAPEALRNAAKTLAESKASRITRSIKGG
jgi:hypothetical protein